MYNYFAQYIQQGIIPLLACFTYHVLGNDMGTFQGSGGRSGGKPKILKSWTRKRVGILYVHGRWRIHNYLLRVTVFLCCIHQATVLSRRQRVRSCQESCGLLWDSSPRCIRRTVKSGTEGTTIHHQKSYCSLNRKPFLLRTVIATVCKKCTSWFMQCSFD